MGCHAARSPVRERRSLVPMSPTVYVVANDAAFRHALAELLSARQFAVRAFASVVDLLAVCGPDERGCLVLVRQRTGMSGVRLDAALAARGIVLPIIAISARGHGPACALSMESLLAQVQSALAADAERYRELSAADEARSRLAMLTPREREVLALAAAGHPSREIARALGISHRTVDVHRARIMRKTGAGTLPELAEFARHFRSERQT